MAWFLLTSRQGEFGLEKGGGGYVLRKEGGGIFVTYSRFGLREGTGFRDGLRI